MKDYDEYLQYMSYADVNALDSDRIDGADVLGKMGLELPERDEDTRRIGSLLRVLQTFVNLCEGVYTDEKECSKMWRRACNEARVLLVDARRER